MSDTTEIDEEPEAAPKKSGGKGMIVALVGALVAGGGGFFATYTGMLDGLLGGGSDDGREMDAAMSEAPFMFVPLEPLIISLGPRAKAKMLKFTAQLEVAPEYVESVTAMIPRIQDVLNTFLRAVDEKELQNPGALTLLRAQMLRRIQIVIGEDQVRDLLIVEFILS